MFYFKDSLVSPHRLDADQLKRVQEFKAKVGDLGGLYWSFDTVQEFESLLRRHLAHIMQNFRAKSVARLSSPSPVPIVGFGQEMSPISDEPRLPPHVFIGTAHIDGAGVSDGTLVSAWMDGRQVNSAEIRDGKYLIMVPGTSTNAQQTVVFTIDDIEANESHVWEHGGANELNLSAGRGGRLPPHVFVGQAYREGVLAVDGTIVSAWIDGSQIATSAVSDGYYILVVDQGDAPFRGRAIAFRVDIFDAIETAIWKQSGGDELNLHASYFK